VAAPDQVATTELTGLRTQLRQPRVAELVASVLRSRILSGELADGAMLPKQEELFVEFGVSPPSIREALRILETEGLVTVQRGNVGGAVVHQPQAAKVVYMMGMVLQSRQVSLSAVLEAVVSFEPACAAACARRPDRATTVLPVLAAVLDDADAAIDDAAAYARCARQFHLEIVANCGNDAMSLVIGALESLWTVHVRHMSTPRSKDPYDDLPARRQSAREHRRLYAQIEKGDADGAERSARNHLLRPEEAWSHSLDTGVVIDAELLEPT
jgi:GntR family transcriptional repressor for pyruvate dehydrogenase complex